MMYVNPNGTFRFDFFKRLFSSVTQDRQFQLTAVKLNYVYDKDNNPTDIVQDISYIIFVPDLMTQLTVKCNSTTPVISSEQLNAAMEAGTDVYVELPVEETFIKPYKIGIGGLLVSIKTPYVKLVKD